MSQEQKRHWFWTQLCICVLLMYVRLNKAVSNLLPVKLICILNCNWMHYSECLNIHAQLKGVLINSSGCPKTKNIHHNLGRFHKSGLGITTKKKFRQITVKSSLLDSTQNGNDGGRPNDVASEILRFRPADQTLSAVQNSLPHQM